MNNHNRHKASPFNTDNNDNADCNGNDDVTNGNECNASQSNNNHNNDHHDTSSTNNNNNVTTPILKNEDTQDERNRPTNKRPYNGISTSVQRVLFDKNDNEVEDDVVINNHNNNNNNNNSDNNNDMNTVMSASVVSALTYDTSQQQQQQLSQQPPPPLNTISFNRRPFVMSSSSFLVADHTNFHLQETQSYPFSQHSTIQNNTNMNGIDNDNSTIDMIMTVTKFCIRDVATGDIILLRSNNITPLPQQPNEYVYRIGRDVDSYIICHNTMVSRYHAELIHDITNDTITLRAINHCRILDTERNRWDIVHGGTERLLRFGDTFRLIPYNASAAATTNIHLSNIQFVLESYNNYNHQISEMVGTPAMDYAYIDLLRTIQRDGQPQSNTKGNNTTLREPYTIRINLYHPKNDILPILTLRKIFPLSAIIECMWYLRGENHIEFLQRNKQSFWDKQALEDGWIGYNYGLLTRYNHISDNGTDNEGDGTNVSINQLEENVLRPLTDGRCSRNMVCTLCHPGEPTVQQACTSSIQFTVSTINNEKRLDLTVTQRSSDVVLGLPNDILVWSILLHLVRREVRIRTNNERILYAGNINFCISAGGAHIYEINESNVQELLNRIPKSNVQPYLIVNDHVISKSVPSSLSHTITPPSPILGIDTLKAVPTTTSATATNNMIGIFELAQTYDINKDSISCPKIQIVNYKEGNYHPYMKIEQALNETNNNNDTNNQSLEERSTNID